MYEVSPKRFESLERSQKIHLRLKRWVFINEVVGLTVESEDFSRERHKEAKGLGEAFRVGHPDGYLRMAPKGDSGHRMA